MFTFHKKQSVFWQILSNAHIYRNILEQCYIILPYVTIMICLILLHDYSYRNYVITFVLPCIYNMTCYTSLTNVPCRIYGVYILFCSILFCPLLFCIYNKTCSTSLTSVSFRIYRGQILFCSNLFYSILFSSIPFYSVLFCIYNMMCSTSLTSVSCRIYRV